MGRYQVYVLETIQRRGIIHANSRDEAEAMDPEDMDLEEYDGSMEVLSVTALPLRDEE